MMSAISLSRLRILSPKVKFADSLIPTMLRKRRLTRRTIAPVPSQIGSLRSGVE